MCKKRCQSPLGRKELRSCDRRHYKNSLNLRKFSKKNAKPGFGSYNRLNLRFDKNDALTATLHYRFAT